MITYSDPIRPATNNDLDGGVVGVSVLVDLDIAIEEGTIFLNPQNHLNRVGGKEMRASKNDASYIPAKIHPLLNNFSHESDYLDKNPKNTYPFDS